jgi:hypothetical protein
MEYFTTDFDLPFQCGASRDRRLGSHGFLVKSFPCDRVLKPETASFFAKFGRMQIDLDKVAVSLWPAPPVKFERSVIAHPSASPDGRRRLNSRNFSGKAVKNERNAVSGSCRMAQQSDPYRRTDPNMHSLGLEKVYSEVSQGVGFDPRLVFRTAPGCKSGGLTLSISP